MKDWLSDDTVRALTESISKVNEDHPLIVNPSGDTYFIGDLAAGKSFVELDRYVREVEHPSGQWRVALCDDPQGKSEAEWGSGPTLEEAWRFALGAYFGPIDDEYDEDRLVNLLAQHKEK